MAEFAENTVTEVIRAAAPGAEIAEWAVVADEYAVMTPSTASLERVVAKTTDGGRVSVFAKTLQSTPLASARDHPGDVQGGGNRGVPMGRATYSRFLLDLRSDLHLPT
jgi:hypothetical protein